MNFKDMKGALPQKKDRTPPQAQTLGTVWGEALDPASVLQEYPRPRMVRGNCTMLNGYWNYAISKEPGRPAHADGRILVPFSPESALSGVGRQLKPDEYLWYERRAQIPPHRAGERVLLHFEAVDQCAAVWINGRPAGRHIGGYLPFTIDVTDHLRTGEETFRISVRVQDFSDTSWHSRGKQKLHPGGMYYTAQSGIWQSVWLEVVPARYLEDVLIEPDSDLRHIHVTLTCAGAGEKERRTSRGRSGGNGGAFGGCRMLIFAPTVSYDADDPSQAAGTPILVHTSQEAHFTPEIPDPKCWSPDHPWLYPAVIEAGEDRVRTYFAVRCISAEADAAGKKRACLNHVPVFLNGVLDQGYWPDGLYTPPADEALVYDIVQMKALGFNMLRKHAKIECRRWYYHCDRLGMLIWQDMVNGGGAYSALLLTYLPTGLCVPGPLMKRQSARSTKASLIERLEACITGRRERLGRAEFRRECRQTIALLRGHPSVMTWVIFNEGWGQFDTRALAASVKEEDPGRLVDAASGWFEHMAGDYKSVHNYFRKLTVPADVRIVVLSEYGGAVYHVEGHSMFERTYGYHTCTSAEEFEETFRKKLLDEVLPLRSQGLSGAVYTQVSDIEEETNGLLTYDRKVRKISEEGAAALRAAFAADAAAAAEEM